MRNRLGLLPVQGGSLQDELSHVYSLYKKTARLNAQLAG
jgi:hypothetical protein